jgi:hypothetical protein
MTIGETGRHCEESKRRSNPESYQPHHWIASLALAMTGRDWPKALVLRHAMSANMVATINKNSGAPRGEAHG